MVENSLHSDRPDELRIHRDPATHLRDEYFDCLASGKNNCSTPSRDSFKPGSPESIELTNPFTAPHAVPEQYAAPHSQWTLAFNLSTTVDHGIGSNDESDERVYAGARSKTAQLLQLAEQTRGKPVSLVVQNAEPEPLPSTGGSNSSHDSGPQMMLHTYIINDGKISELPTRRSQGVAADTQALTAIASHQAPSDRLALFSQSHGGGPHGLSGDTGRATPEELRTAITNGLAGSGRSRLDLLDFDACSMGNDRVLQTLSGTTDRIVASTETETTSGTRVDGQNIQAIVNSVLSKPDMDSNELGRDIVQLAATGANGGEASPVESEHSKPGTPTLSLYDTSAVPAFDRSLDNLGRALNRAWSAGSNGDAILRAVNESPLSTDEHGGIAGGVHPEQRDVGTLASNLVRGIADGSIRDDGGALGNAARDLLRAEDQLVTAYHGEHTGGYDSQRGLSVFLPGQQYLNNQSRANDMNPSTDLSEISGSSKSTRFSSQNYVAERINEQLEAIRKRLGPDANSALVPLEQAQSSVAHATDQEHYSAALNELSARAKTFQQTEPGKKLQGQFLAEAQESQTEDFNREVGGMTTTGQWRAFLETLKANAPRTYRD